MPSLDGFDRRDFICRSLGTLALPGVLGVTIARAAAGSLARPRAEGIAARVRAAPRLFCVAYITPDAPGQGGQEAAVARYPLALVPQDMRGAFAQWRDRVRRINPAILLLAYQMVIEENTLPGPGHDELRKVRDGYCVYPGGFVPTVTVPPSTRSFRIFDTRSSEWRARFLSACDAVLRSYPYDGLFLDNCTVYDRAHPFPGVRADMRHGLQQALLELRHQHPGVLIVANSSYHWSGLNGEMVEGRPLEIATETAPYPGHTQPVVELVQALVGSSAGAGEVSRQMQAAHAQGAFFGAAIDYQHVVWFDEFDAVVATQAGGSR